MEKHAAEDEGGPREQNDGTYERARSPHEARLRDPELAREGRERWRPGDREGAEHEAKRGERSDLDRAAESRQAQRAVTLTQGARDHEEGRLCERVVEHMERGGKERKRSADPHGQRDDAHVLDRGIRQQPLEVVLDQHERYRHEDRKSADAEQ